MVENVLSERLQELAVKKMIVVAAALTVVVAARKKSAEPSKLTRWLLDWLEPQVGPGAAPDFG